MRRLLAVVASCSLLTFAGLALAPTPVAAGSNGQQLEMYDNLGWTGVCYDGTNQNGYHQTACGSATPNVWNQYPNWWWVGWTMYGPSNPPSYSSVYVPKSQSSNWTCFVLTNPGGAWGC